MLRWIHPTRVLANVRLIITFELAYCHFSRANRFSQRLNSTIYPALIKIQSPICWACWLSQLHYTKYLAGWRSVITQFMITQALYSLFRLGERLRNIPLPRAVCAVELIYCVPKQKLIAAASHAINGAEVTCKLCLFQYVFRSCVVFVIMKRKAGLSDSL